MDPDVPSEAGHPHQPEVDRGFASRLLAEVALWQRDGLVTEDQGRAIVARYPVQPDRARRNLGGVLAFLGAALVGAGVIAFFASRWSFVPGWAKLALIFASVVAAHAAGYRLRFQTEMYHGTGNALLFLGALLYGAAIFLIAQGFHVVAGEPSLLVLWVAGILPMAYLLRSRPILVLSVAVLAIALGWEASFWCEGRYGVPAALLGALMLLGCALFALSGLHATSQSLRVFGSPLGTLGLLAILGAFVPLTMEPVHHFWGSGMYGSPFHALDPGATVRAIALVAITLLAVGVSAAARRREAGAAIELGGLLLVAVTGAMMLWYLGTGGLAAVVLLNVAALLATVGAVAAGTMRREPHWVNVGVAAFALQMACRYCDIFWNLMPPEAFFTGAGVVLLAGGMALERTRRRVLGRMEQEVRHEAV